jgi:uncharacterized protein
LFPRVFKKRWFEQARQFEQTNAGPEGQARPTLFAIVFALSLAGVLTACARESWPDPPPIDAAAYQKEHDSWRQEQKQWIGNVIAIVGIWPLAEGETAFGSDAALPIVLPASVSPARGGVFRRSGDTVTVVPAPGSPIHAADGKPVSSPAPYADGMRIGSVLLQLERMDGGRLFVSGLDEANPAIDNPPDVPAFPQDARWRVAARFDAIEPPRPIKVSDIRGGTVDYLAVGQLFFRLEGREFRLTALGRAEAEEDEPFFIMFKDRTNGATTYGGYRMLLPKRVKNGEFTVLDFNMAENPPCAYSPYTTCPLPPAENRLDVAIEAGLKSLPSVKGFTPS